MAIVRPLPGGEFVLETGTLNAPLPGGGWVQETQSAGGAYTLTASHGSYSYTGQSVNISYTPTTNAYTLTASYGSYGYTGQSVNLYRNRNLTPNYGSYNYTGQSVNLYRNRNLTSNYGSYSYTGQSVSIYRDRSLVVSNGSYSYTGQNATITAVARYGRPAVDITTGTWAPSSGSDLYEMLNESVANDADYISTSTLSDLFEVKLSPTTDPNSSTGHVISIRLSSNYGNSINLTLKQGSSTLDSWSVSSLTSTPTTYTRILSGAVIDSITDYTDLRITGTSA